MTVFSASPITPLRSAPDATKHVKFTYGMVLDAEDFGQEFAYLAARVQWTARDLIGYGTVSGLKVSYETNGGNPRLVVDSGVAVTPRGELVHVGRAQCAYLNDWLKTDEASARAGAVKTSPTTSRLDVFVTLCYRECETDLLPIPGEPCRDENEMKAPSRVADDFRLELRLTAPEQPDEQAVRDFVQWLSQVPIVDGASALALPQFLDALRAAASGIGSPPSSPPDFMYGMPPSILAIGRADACRYFRAAYRLWAVELRPKWNASWWDAQSCGCGPADTTTTTASKPESCVLLTRVGIPLVATSITGSTVWQVASSPDPAIDDEDRPFIVPTRMLQESLWCGCACGTGAGTDGAIVAGGAATVTSAAAPSPASGKYQLQLFRPTAPPAGWTAGDFWVLFKGYVPPLAPTSGFTYVVSATPTVSAGQNLRVEFAGFDTEGIRLRLKDNVTAISPVNQQVLIEVKQYAK